MCNRGFRTWRYHPGRAVGADDHSLTVGGIEDAPVADVVDDKQVAALAFELDAGVIHDRAVGITGLGGETNNDRTLAGAGLHQLGEDVRVLDQLDVWCRAVVRLLDLRGRLRNRSE